MQPHWQVTEFYLTKLDAELARILGSNARARALLYAATAGHHGRPPDLDTRRADRMLPRKLRGGLREVRKILVELGALWPGASLEGIAWDEAIQLSWWLPGLVSAADWIGSNAEWFPAKPCDLPLPKYLALARKKVKANQDSLLSEAQARFGMVKDGDLPPRRYEITLPRSTGFPLTTPP